MIVGKGPVAWEVLGSGGFVDGDLRMLEGAWEKKIIWECGFERRTINIKHIDWHSSRGGEEELEILQHKIDFGDELLLHREPIDPSTAPDYAFFSGRDIPKKQRDNLPDLCMVHGGVFFVSEAFRDLLSGFDIGQTQFFEVPLFEFDQKTRRPGRWFFLSINELKGNLILDASDGLEEQRPERYFPMAPEEELRDDPPFIGLREEAASGVELWYEIRLPWRFFLSDRLKRAIKAEKMKIRSFPLKKLVLAT